MAQAGHLWALALMRWIARRLWSAIPIRPWLAFWRRQAPHTWLETVCCRVILMARRRRRPGSPNYFVGSQDNNGPYGAPPDALNIWKFHYDPMTPGNSTFMLTNTLPTQPFNSILALCGGTRNCIPQPGTTNRIDHLGYRQRPLFRLAYRNFGSHESLVTNQSVSAGTGPNGEVSGIRWWELRSPNSSPVIFQQGTYAPGLTDGIHRWMGSIAMNSLGDIALSFSASNGTNPAVFPSVFYTARHAGDPPGQMTLGEGSIINGTGSQTGQCIAGAIIRAIDIDPIDDTTFWVRQRSTFPRQAPLDGDCESARLI